MSTSKKSDEYYELNVIYRKTYYKINKIKKSTKSEKADIFKINQNVVDMTPDRLCLFSNA